MCDPPNLSFPSSSTLAGMEEGTPPRSSRHLTRPQISTSKETYKCAIVVTSLFTAVTIAVFVHVREQLNLLGSQSKPAFDPGSPQATALLIVAYLAVLSNGAAAIMSYILLEKLNSITPNDAQIPLTVSIDTAVDQSSIPSSMTVVVAKDRLCDVGIYNTDVGKVLAKHIGS
ncbi:hypothetical protein FRB91_004589 [Serendipita sp. 411]|nr:hypothetical protein FRC18_010128 [Serendipita sp. 400]KAG8860196.1 hypothetical protein FRB91_004589 [Serendipita sp. 411]